MTNSFKAYAKVNLSLDVGPRRADGYHEISTVMQMVPKLYDEIRIDLVDGKRGVTLACSDPLLPTDSGNLAYRAAMLYLDAVHSCKGARIYITKRIPIAAGLAGGSSDAAAVLMGLNRLCDGAVDTESLCEMAARLGSDVPFFIAAADTGAALCTGRGEIVEPLPRLPVRIEIECPRGAAASTAEIYRLYDETDDRAHPDVYGQAQALRAGDIETAIALIGNSLEAVTIRLVPEIRDIEQALQSQRAVATCMSGSGPAAFGIFT